MPESGRRADEARIGSRLSGPVFSYTTIGLLQLKVVWAIWAFRELSVGDTSYYFLSAVDWHRSGRVQFSWSPLYTSFLGVFLDFWQDAYAVITAHRFVIVMALSLLVLALMRRLLPPAVAWGAAAWWVIMPVNFNAPYEIHLFALIPAIVALLLLGWRSPWGRGGALAILMVGGLLVRNELLIAGGMLLLCCFVAELRGRISLRNATPYVACALVALAFCGFYLQRASDRVDLGAAFSGKERFVFCQNYAFSYQQRHNDFTASPWTECGKLMTRVYGTPRPSMAQAFAINPSAMLEHVGWNIRLMPYGLQVLLFNLSAGRITPDYEAVIRGGPIIWLPSMMLLALLVAGLWWIFIERQFWTKPLPSSSGWIWVGLACFAIMTAIIMLVQRPRPSYIFILGIGVRALAGMCFYVLTARTAIWNRLNRWFPAVAMLLVVVTPPAYPLAMAHRPRLFHDQYERLAPFQARIESKQTVLAGLGLFQETCNYLIKANSCYPLDTVAKTDALLRIPGVDMIYLEDQQKADALRALGWRKLAGSNQPGTSWCLLRH